MFLRAPAVRHLAPWGAVLSESRCVAFGIGAFQKEKSRGEPCFCFIILMLPWEALPPRMFLRAPAVQHFAPCGADSLGSTCGGRSLRAFSGEQVPCFGISAFQKEKSRGEPCFCFVILVLPWGALPPRMFPRRGNAVRRGGRSLRAPFGEQVRCFGIGAFQKEKSRGEPCFYFVMLVLPWEVPALGSEKQAAPGTCGAALRP